MRFWETCWLVAPVIQYVMKIRVQIPMGPPLSSVAIWRKSQILIAGINTYMKNVGLIAMNKKVSCQHCKKETTVGNIKKHEAACYLNPNVMVTCLVCEKPIKNYKVSKGTCSKACANKHFRSGEDNGNWKGTAYRSICWQHHKKECVVCKEDKIVTVHHMNEDHNDNRPENLVPLCPTHHQYLHSRYRKEIIDIVEDYVYKYINKY